MLGHERVDVDQSGLKDVEGEHPEFLLVAALLANSPLLPEKITMLTRFHAARARRPPKASSLWAFSLMIDVMSTIARKYDPQHGREPLPMHGRGRRRREPSRPAARAPETERATRALPTTAFIFSALDGLLSGCHGSDSRVDGVGRARSIVTSRRPARVAGCQRRRTFAVALVVHGTESASPRRYRVFSLFGRARLATTREGRCRTRARAPAPSGR